ncbi:MAG TPA: hypothetical protein VKW04_11925 [Planctomycetota bacterium]|nr:hypothetical protein [Planctomycetota bacterium]
MKRTLATIALLAAAATAARAQDFQVGSRAKAMGGSYTAFGDDPVAIWTNPAGTATQPTQVAVTYQSFTEYEFHHLGDTIPPSVQGDPKQGLLDPPITPSFLGIVVQVGEGDVDMAVSIAYIRPFQIKYVYNFFDPNDSSQNLITQTDQQFSRIRAAYGISIRVSDSPFFRTLAVGGAVDFVYTNYKEEDQSPLAGAGSQIFEDSESSYGYGLGLLVTAYESDSFRVDAGAAYNSDVRFHFSLDPTIYPVWDYPALASGGLAFYIGEGYPLRMTLDAQWIGWKDSVSKPDTGFEGFRNTLSYSAGAEYRFKVGETHRLFARMGVKSFDTPWKDKNNLPAVGDSQLNIKTKGNRIEILTLGAGLYWTRKTADGETRSSGIDLAIELLGEARVLFGLSYTYQFD